MLRSLRFFDRRVFLRSIPGDCPQQWQSRPPGPFGQNLPIILAIALPFIEGEAKSDRLGPSASSQPVKHSLQELPFPDELRRPGTRHDDSVTSLYNALGCFSVHGSPSGMFRRHRLPFRQMSLPRESKQELKLHLRCPACEPNPLVPDPWES